jgi:hypothetical protein
MFLPLVFLNTILTIVKPRVKPHSWNNLVVFRTLFYAYWCVPRINTDDSARNPSFLRAESEFSMPCFIGLL